MKQICFLMVLIVFVGFLTNQVIAFGLSPLYLELEAIRGETVKKLLNVSNSDSTAIFCYVYTTNWGLQSNGGQQYEQANQKYSATRWLKIQNPQLCVGFEIPAQGNKEIGIEINIPSDGDIEAGDYYACVFVQTKPFPGRPQREDTIFVSARLGCILQITVQGPTIPKMAEVSEVKVEIPSAENKEADIKVIATIANRCALHLDATGEVLIKNSDDRIFDKFTLQAAGRNVRGRALVYPMASRDFLGTVQKRLLPGEYIAEVVFDYDSWSKTDPVQTKFIVSQELGEKQKEFLTLSAQPNPIELEMLPSAFSAEFINISNLDLNPLTVKVVSLVSWIAVEPAEFTIQPAEFDADPDEGQSLCVMISVSAGESATRAGKIMLIPERGKPVVVDIVVSEKKEEEK